jgi:site-specific recombinase XerC
MADLDSLFEQFLRERTYLKNVSPKTLVWYETAWKAFDNDGSPLTRARLQAFLVRLRDRGVSAVSCNSWIKALNAFRRWLHEEGHLEQRLHLPPRKVPRKILKTLDIPSLKALLGSKPRDFRQWRVFAVAATILDTGCRIDELLDARRSPAPDFRFVDRLGRNLRHLILLLDERQAVGVGFVSLAEGTDATTPRRTAPASRSRSNCGIRAGTDSGTGLGGSGTG